ncbi:hypothetical protein CVT24_005837 [Panaeolus cyanescens]|uniref:Mid2 domain-containing protein n=1 Tax=Panaeolus cyanescens TaxID=181874 RepID=A0A409V921_9AGAR|nr:hypothetical protein CVT24_005837 [Panaeolus cyanescens]
MFALERRILGGTSSSDLIASTNGSAQSTGNIIPQAFFQFRASAMRLSPTNASDAIVNLTISTPESTLWVTYDSSFGPFKVLKLRPNETSLLAITYLSDNIPGALFEIESIELTVEANATISSFLPTPTLPPSASLPTFILPSNHPINSTALPSSSGTNLPSRKAFVAMAVGITVGLGLGLTAVALLFFVIWKRRRRRNTLSDENFGPPETRMAESRSEWRDGTDGTISPHWSWRRVGLGSVANRGQVSPVPSVGRTAGRWIGNHFVNGRPRERSGP